MKKEKKQDEPKICYLCGKEITPPDKSEYIKTRRRTEIWIHAKCVSAAKTQQ